MQKPNWNEWKHTPDVTVWQACALSMDIDPHSMVPHRRLIGTNSGEGRPMEKDAVGPSLEPYDFSSADEKAEFERRQRALRMHLSNRTFFSFGTRNQIQPDNSLVRLSEFASWAVSVVMWEGLPAELVEMASALPKLEASPAQIIPAKPLATTEQPLLTAGAISVTLPHLPKKLAAVFQIMRDNWMNYDPKRLPKQTNIAREIGEALGWKEQADGSPSRDAKTIAMLIKPDAIDDTE